MSFLVDTNLCSKIPNNSILEPKWTELSNSLEQAGHKYVVCPLVLIELLIGLAKPEPNYFQSDLRRFLFLAGDDDPEVLSFPGAFVLRTILNEPSPVARFGPSDFQQWLDVTRRALSRDDLVSGNVELYESDLLSYGIDLSKIQEQHEKGRQAFIEVLEGARRKRAPLSSRSVRSAGFLRRQNIIPQRTDVEKIATALDAVHTFYESMFQLAVSPDYDFRAADHSGDWIDYQLLYYLADPEMQIITNDAKFKHRVEESSQSKRIHVLS